MTWGLLGVLFNLLDTETPVKKLDMTESMRARIAVVVALLLLSFIPAVVVAQVVVVNSTTYASETRISVTAYPCSTQPQGQELGFGSSSIYENFEVQVFIETCIPQFAQYADIGIIVDTAWINNPVYQNASKLGFSFQSAYYWANGCSLAAANPQPQVSLKLVQAAYYNKTEQRYYPPAYSGHADLCFEYPQSYSPVFLIYLKNGTEITLHQAPSQAPFLLNIGALATSTSTTQTESSSSSAWVVGGLVLAVIVVLFGSLSGFFSFMFDIRDRRKRQKFTRKVSRFLRPHKKTDTDHHKGDT